MTRRLRLAVLAFLVATAITSLAASPQRAVLSGANDAPLTATVPVDPRITVGTLSNGLRYYVRANKQPQDRAELRLVVNAGSVLEDDDQRGLAHFVEHMCFNGTRHFPKQDVVAFLQSTGMHFGAHINANTSFDQTVYQLQIPTDSPAVIDRSLLILEDWAHAVSFEPQEIDKERGVILEEWRTGLGAGRPDAGRAAAGHPQGLPLCRCARRSASRRSSVPFPYDRLKKFYTDWYRPDLMAVIVVGDFDPAAIEAHDQVAFLRHSRPRPRPGRGRSTTCPSIRARSTRWRPTPKRRRPPSASPTPWPRAIRRPSARIVSRRSSGSSPACCPAASRRSRSKPDAPFLDADTNRSIIVQSTEATTLNALVREGGVEKGLGALFTEADRVARFGFTQTELDRYRLSLLKAFEQLAASNDEHTSESLADEFIRNFLQQEPIPGIAYEYALVRRFLPEITLADVNGLAVAWMPERNRVVAVSAPKKDGVAVPDEAALAAAIKGATGGALTAYVDTVSSRPLLEPLPKPGAVSKTATRPPAITEWTLSNGVRVVLDPTTFKQDEILFRAFSPGGTSLASDSDFVPAETATEVVDAGRPRRPERHRCQQEAGGQGGGGPTRHSTKCPRV